MSADMGALLRITELAEKLGGLDAREGEHFGLLTGKLAGLAEAVQGTDGRLSRHGQILAAMDGLDQQVIELARHVAALSEAGQRDDDGGDGGEDAPSPYRPAPSARWWDLRGEDRAAAVARLRAWVEDVYLPGYGSLAAALPDCWAEHDLCLYSLDAMAELWMVLYLNPRRSPATLAGQAEWQTRTLPLYAAQMQAEAQRCEHSMPRGWAGR